MFVLTNGCSDTWVKMAFADKATALAFVKLCWTYGLGTAYTSSSCIDEVTVNDCGWSTETHEEVVQWNDINGNAVTEPKVITAEMLATIDNAETLLDLELMYSLDEAEEEDLEATNC